MSVQRVPRQGKMSFPVRENLGTVKVGRWFSDKEDRHGLTSQSQPGPKPCLSLEKVVIKILKPSSYYRP